MSVVRAEAVMEPRVWPLPALTTVSDRHDFNPGDSIEGFFDKTGSHGHSADTDAFPNVLVMAGPDAEARAGVGVAIKIVVDAG
jgi:hypothetical protein